MTIGTVAVRGLARRVRSTSMPSRRGKPELEQDQRREGRPQAVPEGVPAEQVVECLLAVARHADPLARGELAERPEQQLRLERVGLHQQDVEVVRQHQAAGAPSVR